MTRVRQLLRRMHVAFMLQANYNWGPRLATALRKRWVIFKNPQANIQFKGSVYLGPGFSLYMPAGGNFIVGSGTEFRRGFRAEVAHGGTVEIGARCVFSYYSLIQCSTLISIGDRAMFGQSAIIVDGNHKLQDISTDIFAQPYDYRDIIIANDVTTLTKVTILNSIGVKSVVAANAVVDKPIPPYSVYGGVPARILDYFGPPELEPPEWAARRQKKGIPDPPQRPNTLEVTGHSIAHGGGVSAFANRYTTLLAERLDATEVNRSVAGAIACWPGAGKTLGDGGYAHVLQVLQRPADVTARLPENLTGVTNFGVNDLALLGPSNLAPFAHALRVVLSRHRAASVFEESDPSVRFSDDWEFRSGTDDAGCSGEGVMATATQGAWLEIAIPAEFPGGTVALGFAAEPDGGAIHVVEVDGQETARLDTHDVTAHERRGGAVLRVGPLSAGAHEIRCTVELARGSTAFDYWQIEQATSPRVLVPLAFTTEDWSPYADWAHTPDNSDVPVINETMRAVAAEFGEGVICLDTERILDRPELHGNGPYPSDDGHRELARAMHEALLGDVQKTGVSA